MERLPSYGRERAIFPHSSEFCFGTWIVSSESEIGLQACVSTREKTFLFSFNSKICTLVHIQEKRKKKDEGLWIASCRLAPFLLQKLGYTMAFGH